VRLLGRSKALKSQGLARRRIGLRGFANRGCSVKALGNDALSAVAPLIASVRSVSFATGAVDVLTRVELAEDYRHTSYTTRSRDRRDPISDEGQLGFEEAASNGMRATGVERRRG